MGSLAASQSRDDGRNSRRDGASYSAACNPYHRLMNRLSDESSPYLRQHASNPVDWFPWGEHALAEAARRDRPILLSVGYSACHWCHVMAHESFEHPDTAAMMNNLFVNVKVDREERPDIDAIYMEAVQAMTGRGGWPMTVFLTPDGHPFFGGTYYPPTRRGQMPSFQELMTAVDDAWINRRSDVVEQAGRLGEALHSSMPATSAEGWAPELDQLVAAAGQFAEQFDSEWGGFGGAPKFPSAMGLDALLQIHRHTSDPKVLEIVTTSLDAMASGGIHDHIGGGFARYSVDRQWLVPHFEKMLYDNALLLRVYLHAWQSTGEQRFRQVANEIIEYVLRDLRHDSGGFHSAEDADSEGVEGRYYVWTDQQFRAVCDGAGVDADVAAKWWGVTKDGNFEGANILHRPVRGDLIRSGSIEAARAALLTERDSRVRPGVDDKVLTEWNALFLSSLSEASAATGNERWKAAAVANGEFLINNLRRSDGRWMRSWQSGDGSTAGQARHLAYAQDHAALIDAFTRLSELTGESRWISHAADAADAMIELFADTEDGGFFTTGSDAVDLIKRPKDLTDNATPSAQSLAAVALLRLGAITGIDRYTAEAERILSMLSGPVISHPTGFGHLLTAVNLSATGIREVVIPGDRPDLVASVQSEWRPEVVLAWGEPHDSPLWEGRREGLAYVCHNYTCQAPVGTVEELRSLLGQ